MNEWIDIAALSDIPKRSGRVVKTKDGCIAIFRTFDDRVFAIDDSCPHKNGAVRRHRSRNFGHLPSTQPGN